MPMHSLFSKWHVPALPHLGCSRGKNVGWVGAASKQLSTMQETAITGYALAVGQARGGLGRGKIIFGYIAFN